MSNPRPRLSVFSRQLLVSRVQAGWPAAHVAEQLGISRATAYKWVRRYRAEGEAGLLDRSSRPHRSPRRLPRRSRPQILAARAEWRYGPDRLGPLLGPAALDRAPGARAGGASAACATPTGSPRHRSATSPATRAPSLHQDHKKLGRIPDGGGWRVLGRSVRPDH